MTDQSPPTFTAPGTKPVHRGVTSPAGELTGLVDGDDFPPRVGESSPFDSIATELAAELTETITLPLEARPGWSAVYRLDINHEELGTWRKAAEDRSQPDQFNELKFACIILGNLNTGILRNGRLIELGSEVLTWRHPEMRRLLGVGRTLDGIRKAYGRDAYVLTASRAVMENAGYGSTAAEDQPLDGDEANPT